MKRGASHRLYPSPIIHLMNGLQVLLTIPGIDEYINACRLTYYIKELDFLVIILGIGIDNSREQLCNGYLLDIAHALHDINRHHAIERAPKTEGLLTDAILNTDGVKHSALGRVNNTVGIDHLDEQAY